MDKTAMENIANANKALELLEKNIRKMGGGIVEVAKVSTNFDQIFATISVIFNPEQLQEYISQSP